MKLSEKLLKQLIVETLKEQEVAAGLSSALTSDEPSPEPLSDEEKKAAEELLQTLTGVLNASYGTMATATTTEGRVPGGAQRRKRMSRRNQKAARASADKEALEAAKEEHERIVDKELGDLKADMPDWMYDSLIAAGPLGDEQTAAVSKSYDEEFERSRKLTYKYLQDSDDPFKEAARLAGDLANKNLLDLPIIKTLVAENPLAKSVLLGLAGASGQEVTLTNLVDLLNPATGV